MRLFIADGHQLMKFVLPLEIQESFLFTYKTKNNKVEKTLSVEENNGKWMLKSNGNINVLENGKVVDSVYLDDYKHYALEIVGESEPKILYCYPNNHDNKIDLDISNLTTITIGSSENSMICYKNDSTLSSHCNINIQNGVASVSAANEKGVFYLNEILVREGPLKMGDRLFINGLRIIYMGNFIRINNPLDDVVVNQLHSYQFSPVNNTVYDPVSEEDSSEELYNPDDYFFHTPRLRTVIEEEEIVIDGPPSEEKQEDMPLLLTLGSSITMGASSLMTGYMVVYGLSSGTRTFASAVPQIVMCVAMIFGSLLIPRLTASWQKKRRKEKEQLRQTKYKAYLEEKETKINHIINSQVQILNENYVSLEECNKIIQTGSRKLWEREIKDRDFLTLRLGKGNAPAHLEIKAPEEHFVLEEDNLKEMVYAVVNRSRTLENVPITVSLLEKRIAALICEMSYDVAYINGLILQLMTFHSATDLKLIFLTSEENSKDYEYARFLPHCWSDDRENRFFATNKNEIKEIASYLEQEFRKRKEQAAAKANKQDEKVDKKEPYLSFAPYYLIITENYKEIKDLPIITELLKEQTNLGFSLLFIEKSMRNLPPQCDTFVYALEKDSCVLEKEINSESQQRFNTEVNPTINMKELSRKLANVPLVLKEGASTLPTSLSFLEMFNVSKIEQLNIINRWQVNNPTLNLRTPIGVHTSGELFYLDLHEKFHGPHGLIAGSTGSGKSEFIITYILSMAVNYHPSEVQFVLIDYKGGGLAGAFENRETGVQIPHLAGTITNLDTSEMNRSLVSIESELKRRQRMFNEVRDSLGESTIDIYKYQKLYREGVIKEPISHLFIISDEFAELKSQQPDFMNQLISTARIGRSLGVHLILATQKPSGVVNDQIWSNSKFRVCLKVQEKSDSMEMLKRPEAASIKEVGRFFLQVGYDEYFDIGQSGWCGAKYIPSDRIIKKVDDSINFIDNTGYVIKSINDIVKVDTTVEKGDQLTNIVRYMYDIAEKQNLERKKLWLDRIPEEIYLDDIIKKYSYVAKPYYINPVIGEYDNPTEQEQGILTLDLTNFGNTVVYGMTGSGKENFVTTLVTSIVLNHGVDEVNMYIIDFGSEYLKMLSKYPHVGDVILMDEVDKMMALFVNLDKEMDKRKDLFADYAGSYVDYCENSGHKLPLIVTVINGYEVFQETYSKISELIFPLIREGSKYGIILILTTSMTNAIRPRMAQYFTNKIALQLADDTEYRALLNTPRGLFPSRSFGRGLVATEEGGYEFQTAFVTQKDEITNRVRVLAEELNQKYPVGVPSIKVLPKIVTRDMIQDKMQELVKVPVGIAKETAEPLFFNFQKNNATIISANSLVDHISFITALVKELCTLDNTVVKVIDAIHLYQRPIGNVDHYVDAMNELVGMMTKHLKQEDLTIESYIYVIIGIGELKAKLNDQAKEQFDTIFREMQQKKKARFILLDNYASMKKLQLEPWYKDAINSLDGIWLGEDVGVQMSISFNNLSMEDRKEAFPHIGFVCENGNTNIIKYVVEEEKNE